MSKIEKLHLSMLIISSNVATIFVVLTLLTENASILPLVLSLFAIGSYAFLFVKTNSNSAKDKKTKIRKL